MKTFPNCTTGDPHSGVPPVTRDSFLAAYVDEYPIARCQNASSMWFDLHVNERGMAFGVLEIDEDPK